MRQELHQLAPPQVLVDHEFRLQCDALMIQCHTQAGVAVVGEQSGFALNRLAPVGPLEAPFPGTGRIAVDDGLMVGQILQHLRGAVPFQIGGGGAQDEPGGGQPPADERGIGQDADPHRHVVAFFHQVDHPVRQHDVQLYLRVLGQEGGPQRCQMQDAERVRHADPQPAIGLAAARADLGLGLLNRCQHFLAALEVALTLGRE